MFNDKIVLNAKQHDFLSDFIWSRMYQLSHIYNDFSDRN